METARICQYSNPGRIVFGPGAVAELGKEVGSKERPLLVTDPGVARAGILEKVTDVLRRAGVDYELFDRVQAEPPVEVVDEAADLYRKAGCGPIIGLGGGSSMDVAKAVSVTGPAGGSVREYARGKPIQDHLPAVYAIPTTAGTGSEGTGVAVVTDSERKMKVVIKNPALVPDVAILDPLLLVSLPARVAAETGADAFTHAVEAYVSPAGHAITDALALSAIEMILTYLPRFFADRGDAEAAGQMQLASCMAGLSFKNAGLGLAHAMAHPLGFYYHLSHGLSCALYLPAVMEFNAPVCSRKFSAIARAAGVDVRGLSPEKAAAEGVGAVRSLFRTVGLPTKLSELGIDFQLYPEMTEEVVTAVPTKTNPKPVDRRQVEALFASAR